MARSYKTTTPVGARLACDIYCFLAFFASLREESFTVPSDCLDVSN